MCYRMHWEEEKIAVKFPAADNDFAPVKWLYNVRVQMKERTLKEAPLRQVDVREQLMNDIKQQHQLRPTPTPPTRAKSPGRGQYT